MKKRWTKFMVLAMSLLLVAGMVASASAAGNTQNSQAGFMRQGIMMGKQHAQTALKVVADLTGLSTTDIRGQRVEGKSLASIAEAKGISEQTVIDKVVVERTATLNQLKADKKITDTQYQSCLSNMKTKITANIERTGVGSGNGNKSKQCKGRMQGAGQAQGMGIGAGQNQGNCICNTTTSNN